MSQEWNLTDLYRSPEDPRIARELKRAQLAAVRFAKRYRDKVERLAKKPARFVKALREYESIIQAAAKPVVYAQLRFSELSTDPDRGAFLQRMQRLNVAVSKELLFMKLELLKISPALTRKLTKHPLLAGYRNYLTSVAKYRKHVLSEKEERIFRDKSLTSTEAFVRLFKQEFARREYDWPEGRSIRKISEVALLSELHHPQRKRRKIAAETFSKGLKEDAPRLTYIYNVIIQDKALSDRYRGYDRPETERHLSNETDDRTVEAMAGAVTESYELVQRFYHVKRKLLRVPKLYDFDRYAPVGKPKLKIPYSQAKRWVLEAFTGFSKEYGEMAREFFDRNWIDAKPRKGKQGGAFCSYVSPDHHPYVLMNYSGNVGDVLTLAHELGHGIHAYLMRERGYLSFHPPLTVAETASVFAEMLVFEHLRKKIRDGAELQALLVKKIESVFATVFRQVALYRFEQDAHRAARSGGELRPDQFNELWRKRQVEQFGKSVVLTEGYDRWWSYIPHFFHTPFYVYAYAFGELLTLALYAQYKAGSGNFVGQYLDLLAAGSSKSPEDLLRPFGVNLSSRRFWRGGIKLIEDLVSRLE